MLITNTVTCLIAPQPLNVDICPVAKVAKTIDQLKFGGVTDFFEVTCCDLNRCPFKVEFTVGLYLCGVI